MELLIFWFVGAIIVGIFASNKARVGFGYFMLSLLFSPVLIGLLVLALPNLKVKPIMAGGEIATATSHVRCPDCRELVRKDARKCKHCGTGLIPQ